MDAVADFELLPEFGEPFAIASATAAPGIIGIVVRAEHQQTFSASPNLSGQDLNVLVTHGESRPDLRGRGIRRPSASRDR